MLLKAIVSEWFTDNCAPSTLFPVKDSLTEIMVILKNDSVPFLETSVFATYQRQQMMLQAETRLNFEVEIQYKAAITPTNMSGPGAKLELRLERLQNWYTVKMQFNRH